MKLKSLFLIVATLAAVSALVFLSRRPAPPPSSDPRIGQPLVDQATVEKATQIRCSDAGKTITLVKSADGTWRVPAYYDFPADFAKISRLVGELTEAKLNRLVTTSPERIARLEFKGTQIALLDAAGKELWSVTLGKTNETGGRFVRFGTEQKAYLANLNTYLDLEPKNWARADLLGLKPDDIAKLEIPLEGAPALIVSREKKDTPFTAAATPAGQKLKSDRVASTLSSLTALSFTDTSDLTDANAAAAKSHQRVFKLTAFDGKTYTIALGRKPEEKKIKPPTADPKVSALPSASDASPANPAAPKPLDPKLLAPEFETIPAGPVYVVATSSDEKSPLNALMQKRAFQIGDYVYTGLPQKPEDLFEPAPPPTPAPAPTPAPPSPSAPTPLPKP